MARVVLGFLLVASLLWIPVFAAGTVHASAGGCLTVSGEAPVHAAEGTAHHHPGKAPNALAGSMIPCCLAVSSGLPSESGFVVVRRDAGAALSVYSNDIGHGLAIEPAERPPRVPFLLTA